jgi:hypothetical protein
MTLRSKFFAMTYDRQMTKVEKAGLRVCREGLLAGAAGRVLEIGAGTGSTPGRGIATRLGTSGGGCQVSLRPGRS